MDDGEDHVVPAPSRRGLGSDRVNLHLGTDVRQIIRPGGNRLSRRHGHLAPVTCCCRRAGGRTVVLAFLAGAGFRFSAVADPGSSGSLTDPAADVELGGDVAGQMRAAFRQRARRCRRRQNRWFMRLLPGWMAMGKNRWIGGPAHRMAHGGFARPASAAELWRLRQVARGGCR